MTSSIFCPETEKDKQLPPSPPPKREISATKDAECPGEPVLKSNLVDFTLDLPYSVYQNNPDKFEKDFIKEISKALNIAESYIRFIDVRRG